MKIDEENEKETNVYAMKYLPKPPCPVAKKNPTNSKYPYARIILCGQWNLFINTAVSRNNG